MRRIQLFLSSIYESVFLADRVVVLTSRPGKVAKIFDVNIQRLRDRTSKEFIEIRAKVLEELERVREDVVKFHNTTS